MNRSTERLPLLFLALALGSASWSIQLGWTETPTPVPDVDIPQPTAKRATMLPTSIRETGSIERLPAGTPIDAVERAPLGDWVGGTVVSPTGEPVLDAVVLWRKPDGDIDVSDTEPDGSFLFLNLDGPDAPGSVTAYALRYGCSTPTAIHDGARLVLDRPRSVLRGHARFPDGSPVRFALVHAQLEEAFHPELDFAPDGGTTTTSSDGSFEFLGASPGRWQISLDDDGDALVRVQTTDRVDVDVVATRPRIAIERPSGGTPLPAVYADAFGPTSIRVMVWDDPESIRAVRQMLTDRELIPRRLEFDASEFAWPTGECTRAVDPGALVLAQRTPGITQHAWSEAPLEAREFTLSFGVAPYWRGDSGIDWRHVPRVVEGGLDVWIEVELRDTLSTFVADFAPDGVMPVPPGRYRLHVHERFPHGAVFRTRQIDVDVATGTIVAPKLDFSRASK